MTPTDPSPEELMVASLEAQLCDIYEGNELLHKELGTANADEIIAMVSSLRAQQADMLRAQTISSLEAQLCDLYEQRERLAQALGVSDPVAIVRLVKDLEAELHSFYRSRDQLAA